MVALSSLAGAGWQFFDNNGVPLSGGKLYTYEAGTTTPAPTYTSSSGAVAHANPIILDSAGRVPSEIWLVSSDVYKFMLTTSTDVQLWVKDDIYGIAASDITASDIIYNEGDVGAVNRTVAARLQDYVSVKDFGAVGNDIADDTAAFAAAAATNKPVVIPNGTYRVSGCLFFARVFFQGGRIRRTGGSLAFAGGIEAPCEQIFLNAIGISQVDVNSDLTPEGWVDWFGTNADAIETCHRIFKVNKFGPRNYVVTRTVILDQSNRQVIGVGGSAEGAGGTRIVLTGPAAVTDPVVRVGTLNTVSVLACARRLNISWINTFRDGVINPSPTNRREDAVPGWLIAGWYESEMTHIFDYGSPIGYRVYGTIGCTLNYTGCVRPNPGASNGFQDFFTAHCIGGYARSFGFIGANASLTIKNSGCAGAVGTARLGVYLFGYIGDTWIDKYEMSQMEFGVYVDGRDAAGATIPDQTAHQDVRVNDCVLDAVLICGITVTNLNQGAGIQLRGNYCAQNAPGNVILVEDTDGLVLIDGGDLIAKADEDNVGVNILNSKTVFVNGTLIKDARVGVSAEGSSQLRITPVMRRGFSGGTYGVYLKDVTRSYVAPVIDGAASSWTHGIYTEPTLDYVETNLSAINWGSFVVANASYKLWYNGATVTTDIYGVTNLRSGTIG